MCRLTTTEAYLDCVLYSHAPERKPMVLKSLAALMNELAKEMASLFDLPNPSLFPFEFGPLARGTALNDDLGLEIAVPLPSGNGLKKRDAIHTAMDHLTIHWRGRADCQALQATESERLDISMLIEGEQGPETIRAHLVFDEYHAFDSHRKMLNLAKGMSPDALKCSRLLRIFSREIPEGHPAREFVELFVASHFRRFWTGDLWHSFQNLAQLLAAPGPKQTSAIADNAALELANGMTRRQRTLFAAQVEEMLTSTHQNINRIRQFFPSQSPYCLADRYPSSTT